VQQRNLPEPLVWGQSQRRGPLSPLGSRVQTGPCGPPAPSWGSGFSPAAQSPLPGLRTRRTPLHSVRGAETPYARAQRTTSSSHCASTAGAGGGGCGGRRGSAGGGPGHQVLQSLVLVVVVDQQNLFDGVTLEAHFTESGHELKELQSLEDERMRG